jgi:putative addiction module CopG family antidote
MRNSCGGHYTDDSEYIRDLIRREQERSSGIEAIRAALIEGETSGEPRPFDAGRFAELTGNPLFGMWQDRKDIGDVAAYARRLRAPRYKLDGAHPEK